MRRSGARAVAASLIWAGTFETFPLFLMRTAASQKANSRLVELAWQSVGTFLRDWQLEPYRWYQEIDVQVEITNRLLAAYKAIGEDTVLGNYKDAIGGFEQNQRWNRVCCEPKISYKWTDGQRYYCHPDIVVWDSIKDPDSPPDETPDNDWPILWLCEIKIDWADKSDWDRDKVGYLLQQGKTQNACALSLHRRRATHGNGLSWDQPQEGFRICQAELPARAITGSDLNSPA